jgi:hypothetical protein
MQKLLINSLLTLSLFFPCACGSSDKGDNKEAGTSSGKDGGVSTKDGNKVKLTDGKTTTSDLKITTSDKGTGTNLSCTEIVECISGCGETDEGCLTACIGKGSTEAQKLVGDLATCMDGAVKGTCAEACKANPQAQDCVTCVQNACSKEFLACSSGGGPTLTGFGDACDPKQPSCTTPLTCIQLEGASKGFCTNTCSKGGELCSGSPTDTLAACTIQNSQNPNEFFCGFLCKTSQGMTFSCPSSMTCSTVDNPPNSGQFACEIK